MFVEKRDISGKLWFQKSLWIMIAGLLGMRIIVGLERPFYTRANGGKQAEDILVGTCDATPYS